MPADLVPPYAYPPQLALDPRELGALTQLGPDAFERWALKGWAESPPPGGVN